jgi:hypothetical protein
MTGTTLTALISSALIPSRLLRFSILNLTIFSATGEVVSAIDVALGSTGETRGAGVEAGGDVGLGSGVETLGV